MYVDPSKSQTYKHICCKATEISKNIFASNTHRTCQTPVFGHLMTANTKCCSLRSGSTPPNFRAAAKTYSTAMSERKFTGMAYHRGQMRISFLKSFSSIPSQTACSPGDPRSVLSLICSSKSHVIFIDFHLFMFAGF